MAPEIEDPEEPGWGQLEVRGREGRRGGERGKCDLSSCSLTQPSLNELPALSKDRKRVANDENADPGAPPTKQPRTIEVDLPSNYDDTAEIKGTGK